MKFLDYKFAFDLNKLTFLEQKTTTLFSDITSISCTICFEPYDTKLANDQQHPQTFCANRHVFCKRCCSLMKDCPICQAKKITSPFTETEMFQRIAEERKFNSLNIAPKVYMKLSKF
jgi:hypothetical protein